MLNYKKILIRLAEKWPAKVLSVVAAIFLFALHRMGELQERFFSVPLQVTVGSLAPSSAYPRTVRISIRGDLNSIYHIVEADIEARLDLSLYTEPGIYTIPVQIQRKGTAAEAETLEISADPAELSLELDTRISRHISIVPVIDGYPETGYEMVSYTIDPVEAVVTGPEKLLAGISGLDTEPVDLRSRNGDFTLRIQIVNPNPLVQVLGGGSVEFRGQVKEFIMIKNFENLPVSVLGLPGTLKAKLEPETASLRIQGRQKELDAVDEKTLLSLDASGIVETGVYELPLAVQMEGLSVDRLEPETIRVEITRAEGQEQ